MSACGADRLRAARGPPRDKVRAPNDLRTRRDHAARFYFWRDADDRLPDIARACRPRCHRRIGGIPVSAEIIQFIPRPGRDDAPTDFPTIAFRSAVQDPVVAHAGAAADQPDELERRET